MVLVRGWKGEEEEREAEGRGEGGDALGIDRGCFYFECGSKD